ncbi:MAG: hypothetical protein NZM11_12175, partial [Anaerolineales bacterium]|nr:hypothetical protein [Anaerolineales bacterium]
MNEQNDLQDEQVRQDEAVTAETPIEADLESEKAAAHRPSATPFSDLFAQIERAVAEKAQAETAQKGEAAPAPATTTQPEQETVGISGAPAAPEAETEPVAVAPTPGQPEAATTGEEGP